MKTVYIAVYIIATVLSFLYLSSANAEQPISTPVPAIPHRPNAPTGLVITAIDRTDPNCPLFPYTHYWSYDSTCRSMQYPMDWSGPNLADPNSWVVTYGDRDSCGLVMRGNTYIEMTRTTMGWPPCGVSIKISPPEGESYAGKQFRIVADVTDNTDQSEVYTDADSSLFKPGVGTRTDILTSKYKDLTVWLQTYTLDENNLPITTKWRNVVIRQVK